MDTAISAILLFILALLLGGVLGANAATENVRKDCEAMQQFRTGSNVFDCKERSK
jgi:hypothetical protein